MPSTSDTVLVVDDDADIREALEYVLADEGYDSADVGGGQEALEYLRAHPAPAVILLDWNMAPMDGSQFMAELAKDDALRRIPVVVLTADVRVADSLETGRFADCLTKPVDLRVLFEVLGRYAARSAPSAT